VEQQLSLLLEPDPLETLLLETLELKLAVKLAKTLVLLAETLP